MKKLFSAFLAVWLMLGSVSFVFAGTKDSFDGAVGMSVIGFNTLDLQGNAVTSDIVSDAALTVINEWATWCSPCVGEMPHFQAVYEYCESDPEIDVQIIGAIHVSDALIILRFAMHLIEIEDESIADINGNGTVEASDAIIVLRAATHLI